MLFFELILVLDQSGSMDGLEQDTVSGFNALLTRQKEWMEDTVYLSTILFGGDVTLLHDRVDLKEIAPMQLGDYRPYGPTALYDAVGFAIRHGAAAHRRSGMGARPRHTLYAIITDGLENVSQSFTLDEVKGMIAFEQRYHNSSFLFLGANQDASATAHKLGIGEQMAASYRPSSAGTALNFAAVSSAAIGLRTNDTISQDWKAEVERAFYAQDAVD